MQHRYFLLNKPANMVSQFVSTHNKRLLCDVDFNFPEGTHAIGRLDDASEGLLILTTDKRVTRLIFLADKPHPRSYLVMVQNHVSDATLLQLKSGVNIKIKEGAFYNAIPTDVQIIKQPLEHYQWAVDGREQYPHTWLLITLTEGKYRQVRKMVMAVRHRCLRLIRLNIAELKVADIAPGQVLEIPADTFFVQAGVTIPPQ